MKCRRLGHSKLIPAVMLSKAKHLCLFWLAAASTETLRKLSMTAGVDPQFTQPA
jgi:hypothetical protein